MIHNSGDEPAPFATRSFHQPDHLAKNAAGSSIPLELKFWTTFGRPGPDRLHPGRYCEVDAFWIGIDPRGNHDNDRANIRPGMQIPAGQAYDVACKPWRHQAYRRSQSEGRSRLVAELRFGRTGSVCSCGSTI